jgi:hypothetical protein
MRAWYCIPSARPSVEANEALRKWHDKGYGIALWRDTDVDVPCCNLLLTGPYPGYAAASNALAQEVLRRDPECVWVIFGGDDMSPDPDHEPAVIASECTDHFGGTFGVMQPTGDRWSNSQGEAYADKVAGSAWVGREFCERTYGGEGPFWHEYFHMFADTELLEVASKLGVFWQRPDLEHYHDHWMRQGKPVPEFLKEASGAAHWGRYSELFHKRKYSGFPGHQA